MLLSTLQSERHPSREKKILRRLKIISEALHIVKNDELPRPVARSHNGERQLH